MIELWAKYRQYLNDISCGARRRFCGEVTCLGAGCAVLFVLAGVPMSNFGNENSLRNLADRLGGGGYTRQSVVKNVVTLLIRIQ